MEKMQTLLVVLEPNSIKQPALIRAVYLAQRLQAQITVVTTLYNFSYELTSLMSQDREAVKLALIQEHQAWVQAVLAPYQETGLVIKVHIEWHRHLFESVIQFAMQHRFDLIMKATYAHEGIQSIVFTPTDWHLLRKSPIPVLLVHDEVWPEQGNIMCALDVVADRDEHVQLNHALIQASLHWEKLLEAEVHLVNSYPETPVNIAIELPDFDVQAYNESIKTQHEQKMLTLANAFDLAPSQCHVQAGLPEDIIPEKALQLNVELVIIGMAGRTGLSAALIGNTAEHVIDNLRCDLLAIKSADYRSPVMPFEDK
jgi:universal stress protein E